jgi:hypothetical protein
VANEEDAGLSLSRTVRLLLEHEGFELLHSDTHWDATSSVLVELICCVTIARDLESFWRWNLTVLRCTNDVAAMLDTTLDSNVIAR